MKNIGIFTNDALTYSEEFIINDNDTQKFILISKDDNPMHTNNEFVKNYDFESKLVHGFHLLSKLSGIVGTKLIYKNIVIMYLDKIKFLKPIYIGQKFIIKMNLLKKVDSVKLLELEFNYYQLNKLKITGVIGVKIL